jgi:hypothetical protein
MVNHYAQLAAEEGADLFVVGTELAGTSKHESAWRSVVGEIRARFRGPLAYAANYDEFEQVQWWDALDFIGIDAYWPLADRPNTSVGELVQAWARHVNGVARVAALANRPVLVTELGYTSQRGTVSAPFDWHVSGVRDDAEQAAAYEAFFRAWATQPWFCGVVVWMWDDLPGRSSDDQALDYTPRGKPAEAVLRNWARRLHVQMLKPEE